MRWRQDGRHRSLTFATKREATAVDRALRQARQQAHQAQRIQEALQETTR